MTLWQEIKEGTVISFAALRANKLRSGLTTLGIVIGIVTVTLMATAIQGLNGAFRKSISSMGSDTLFIKRFSWFNDSREAWLKSYRRPLITLDQIEALSRQATLIKAITPYSDCRLPVTYKNRTSRSVSVLGCNEQFVNIGGNTIAEGRFFNAAEANGGRPVCTIGSGVATNLFPNISPLGKKIRVGGTTVEIVGIMAQQGNFLGAFSLDNQVIVPMRYYTLAFRQDADYEIQIRVASMEHIEDSKEEIRGILRKLRHVPASVEDNFAINQQEMFIATFNRVGGIIASAGLFITGLSLFVGGIGIMNIMFVSVAERTKEIGIRKAIGAKRRTILMQFLTEAAGICLFAGLLGLAIAFPITLVISQFLPATLSLPIVGLAVGVSLLTGIVSGFLPAWRAARMNPVDALRND